MESNYDLAAFDKVLSDVKDIQDKGNFLPDVTTKEGYEASKRFVLDITTPARRALDKAHKETKAPFLDTCRFLDGKKKELMPILEGIEQPHKEAYKAVDAEKKAQKEKFESDIQDKINEFNGYCNQASSVNSSNGISDLIDRCGETDTVEGFYHRAADALKAKEDAMSYLNELLMSTIAREAEQQRQDELAEQNRLAQVEIEKQQEAMRLQQEEINRKQAVIDQAEAAKQAELDEKARLEREASIAEQAKLQAEESSRQALIDANERAKQEAINAENRRLADIETAKQNEFDRQQAEQEAQRVAQIKREENKSHNRKVNRAIVKVLTANGISEEDAIKMVTLAAKKELPQLIINY